MTNKKVRSLLDEIFCTLLLRPARLHRGVSDDGDCYFA
jgi:hypothetical protein